MTWSILPLLRYSTAFWRRFIYTHVRYEYDTRYHVVKPRHRWQRKGYRQYGAPAYTCSPIHLFVIARLLAIGFHKKEILFNLRWRRKQHTLTRDFAIRKRKRFFLRRCWHIIRVWCSIYFSSDSLVTLMHFSFDISAYASPCLLFWRE